MQKRAIETISDFGYYVLSNIRSAVNGISEATLLERIPEAIHLDELLNQDLIFQCDVTQEGFPIYKITARGVVEILKYQKEKGLIVA